MKKILLGLFLVILAGCSNLNTQNKKDIDEYIKNIDVKIEKELTKDPRIKYRRKLTDEELKKQPVSYKNYMEVVEENGYKNIYDSYDHHLRQSLTLGEDGEPYGVYKIFDENEKLTEIGFIDKGGVFSGTKRVYYPNGKLHKLIPYYKNSVEGKRIFYHPNGNIQEIYTYINNKEDGEGRIYYLNGKLKLIENYKEGEKVGAYKIYDSTGRLRQKGINKNGEHIVDEDF
ncbi:toxin-antitoxin system YwqK family antitoxin [Fusobacterium sp.]|uniref:toxin-antitoxin system YwqK family antitoxin n=1 Tax=Fusobacterium sp. TaxID=68766 RepID=UPI00396CB9BE